MEAKTIYGYMGRILRIDLSEKKARIEAIDEDLYRTFVGGVAMGAHFLCKEIHAETSWSSPENRLIITTGPFSGTRISGSGTFCALSKGPMTNMAASTQANGFLGAFLRLSGYDGLIIQGASSQPIYLFIDENGVDFKDAGHLIGKGTLKTQELIKKELNLGRKLSVYTIGQAGEKLVRFSSIVGDGGHVAAHNGLGAVMGSKNLKAIAVKRGNLKPQIKYPDELTVLAKELIEHAKTFGNSGLYKWGTAWVFKPHAEGGEIPVKNYTTNILKGHEKLLPEYTRTHFEIKSKPCWACGLRHVKEVKVTEGPYKGLEGEEPEYESINMFGPLIGNYEPGAVVLLANLLDDLGMDVNESGWTVSWLMDCFEHGMLNREELDGLEMSWGNIESAKKLLEKIAGREGIGDIFAEGVRRASKRIGGKAQEIAVYTEKGNTPRGHDHRGRWSELMDTCLSDTGTIEFTMGPLRPDLLGDAPVEDFFSPKEISEASSKVCGWHQFEDCLGVCRFCIKDPYKTIDCVNTITGWDLDMEAAKTVGKRAINQLRVFNVRHGYNRSSDKPSARYGSIPTDGPRRGIGIMSSWEKIVNQFYSNMGWDPMTGKPLPDTLRILGLDHLIEEN